jgi:hypothetical protein
MRRRIHRIRQAWQVLKHGLPVVEITYCKVRDINTTDLYFAATYPGGKCHGNIEGEELWTQNGIFTVVQRCDHAEVA